MISTFKNQSTDLKSEAEFCPLLQQAFDLWQEGQHEASLAVLSKAESLVEHVSPELIGKFHNQRGLALRALGQNDRAIIEFAGADYHFELCGAVTLQAIVKNNASRAYSLLGDYEHAHESVDRAISLVADKSLLAEFYDTKSRIFSDEITRDFAVVSSKEKSLVYGTAHMVKNPTPSESAPRSTQSSRKDRQMPHALLAKQSHELARQIISNDHNLADPLFQLIARISDADGDPMRYAAADDVMRVLYSYTADSEAHRRAHVSDFRLDLIEPESDSSS